MKQLTLALSCALALMLAGCSSETPTRTQAKKAEEKPPEPVTGRDALYSMYRSARSWGADAQILKLGSIPVPGVKPEPGKAGAWQVTFVSPSKARARSWTFSVVEGEGNLHKGPFAGLEEGWSGPRGVTKPFIIAAVKIDTDAAYQTAMKQKQAIEYDKKNPGKPIVYLLESTSKHPDPAWRVLWGESVGTSNFSVLVDASTGDFLEIVR
jgi:hypothetical protein